MSELPKGWLNSKLSVVGNTVTGNTPPRKNPEFYDGNIPFVKPGDIDFDKELSQAEETLSNLGCGKARVLKKGSVLVTCIGNIGRVGLATQPMATNQQINSIEFDDLILPKYAFYYCRTLSSWLKFNASATTVPIINKSKFSEAPFKVAPLAEQKRIVEKLDEVLAQVDTIKARLDGIPDLLKRFRQSVLASAVSGKLTEEWRGEALNSSWKNILLKEAAHIQDPHPSHRTPKVVEGGVPYISIGDLCEDGSIDFDNARKVSFEILKEHNERYTLKEGDFVFGKIGTLGKATVLPMGIDYTLSANVILIQPTLELTVPKYIQYFLSSPLTMEEIAKQANSTSQSAFGIKKMRAFYCSLPPKEEQKEIVRLVDQYFAFANTIEAQVKKAQVRVDNLTQSILAKAFRGELVLQDPNDESADKLLERIAKAREEAEALAKAAKKAEAAKKRAAKATK
ncbi:restriction endonuclease subunit S [uncultured Vibrio sp.]|uniref:restriction endonuclease subunit S n=1 Tax=uncultured Vibrio sp. TaxID=114054 RepID=UPI00260A7E55|nr:restriction endonuclease subunit S [uncultured Vibrio sp.]